MPDGNGAAAWRDGSLEAMDKNAAVAPVLFAGHGSPMNAIEDNRWSRLLAELGQKMAKPRAVLAVSAHWYGRGLSVSAAEHPSTIHDFGGFPDELFAVRYPAPGSPGLAERVAELLGGGVVGLSRDRGLDHGAWSVLIHLFPLADVPVVQLSVDATRDAAGQVELGRRLSVLRDDGVLLLASGNVTHNLGAAFSAMRTGDVRIPSWASGFDEAVRRALEMRDRPGLEALLDSDQGRLAHPSPDHWFPLLFAFGASRESDGLSFPVEGFDLGSLSMRSCLWS